MNGAYETSVGRAIATYDAMQRAMYEPGSRLYRETAASNSPVAFLWPFSRALVGTACVAGVRGNEAAYRAAVADRIRALDEYRARDAYMSAVLFVGGGDIYYDDNAWVALALVMAYRLGILDNLDRVKRLFAFAEAGWDRQLGGVYWVQQGRGVGSSNHDRGAGATAGSAEIGFHLHELVQSETYERATRMVEWVAQHLDASGTGSGPFLNVVRADGSIDTNVWSYNQGVMLGARVLQFRVTGDRTYVRMAEAIASQTLRTFGDFRNHPPSFNGMCFQNMLMLHAATSDVGLQDDMRAAMDRYADWAWDPNSGARDPETNLFFFDDGGRPARGAQAARVQDQGALTQMYALLAWDPADYVKLT